MTSQNPHAFPQSAAAWLSARLPISKHGGALLFKEGVINPWRVIGDHELFIFSDGDARMTVEGVEYPCPDGSFIIIPPGLRHLSICLSPTVWVRWSHFDWELTPLSPRVIHLPGPDALVPKQASAQPAGLHTGVIHGRLPSAPASESMAAPEANASTMTPSSFPYDPSILALHDRMVRLMRSGHAPGHAVSRSLFMHELCLILFSMEGGLSEESTEDRLLRRSLTVLDELAQKPVREGASIMRAFAGLGKSYAHLQRLFRRRRGQTPEAYVNLVRMERAQHLLLETDLSVGEVSRHLGFDDPAHFTRCFVRSMGKTPRELRKRG